MVPFRLPSRILNLYRTKWALACVCFSFFYLFFWLRVLDLADTFYHIVS